MQGPAPGAHQRVLHPPDGPAFTLGRRLRDLLGLKAKMQMADGPAPGDYYNEFLALGGVAYSFPAAP